MDDGKVYRACEYCLREECPDGTCQTCEPSDTGGTNFIDKQQAEEELRS